MVNINNVYQTVLAIANKEQRGYITPQEFNMFANHAQMSIFEQYFYDLNQFTRRPGNDTSHSDMVDLLQEKISLFEESSSISSQLPPELYKIIEVRYRDKPVEYVTRKEHTATIGVPLVKPTDTKPVYVKSGDTITVYGDNIINSVNMSYIRKPLPPNWTYLEVQGAAVYNNLAPDHRNFELHASEETELVNKILALAGVAIKDYSLYQAAAGEDNKNIQQQKA